MSDEQERQRFEARRNELAGEVRRLRCEIRERERELKRKEEELDYYEGRLTPNPSVTRLGEVFKDGPDLWTPTAPHRQG